ncbi:hypothetical protein NX059_007622 [Plenodomus lindquistii]|nr:hypothetical protein NX059_007622 [Plenodomus lindquistii]
MLFPEILSANFFLTPTRPDQREQQERPALWLGTRAPSSELHHRVCRRPFTSDTVNCHHCTTTLTHHSPRGFDCYNLRPQPTFDYDNYRHSSKLECLRTTCA